MQTLSPTPSAASAGNCTALTPPLPGQLWPELQGRYAGIMRSDDGLSGWHLILPEGPDFALTGVKWGKAGQDVTGACRRFDGLANTLAMVAAGSALAKKVRKLPGGCYIPSRAEAALLYAVMPEHVSGWTWTSTQYSDGTAWVQDFDDGYQLISGKSYEGRCRAVRRLALQSFSSSTGAA